VGTRLCLPPRRHCCPATVTPTNSPVTIDDSSGGAVRPSLRAKRAHHHRRNQPQRPPGRESTSPRLRSQLRGPRDGIGVVRGGFTVIDPDDTAHTFSLANGNTAGATAGSAFLEPWRHRQHQPDQRQLDLRPRGVRQSSRHPDAHRYLRGDRRRRPRWRIGPDHGVGRGRPRRRDNRNQHESDVRRVQQAG